MPRLAVSCPSGTLQYKSYEETSPNEQESLTGINSDGIARVHGMANVQAEELVEYVLAKFCLSEPT